MSQHYSDPAREDDKYALPDVETFYIDETDRDFVDEDGNRLPIGWYFWYCLPGCMPDSEPNGPYATEQEAIDACRDALD